MILIIVDWKLLQSGFQLLASNAKRIFQFIFKITVLFTVFEIHCVMILNGVLINLQIRAETESLRRLLSRFFFMGTVQRQCYVDQSNLEVFELLYSQPYNSEKTLIYRNKRNQIKMQQMLRNLIFQWHQALVALRVIQSLILSSTERILSLPSLWFTIF